jgi:predicted AAA+ superfamily ATPase
MPTLFPRHNRELIVAGLQDTRVVFVAGARQVGKTTLTQDIAEHEHSLMRISLDDDDVRTAAQEDPTGFVAGLPGPALIDEVQRAPDLLLAIKSAVDRNPEPGQFLLTGSANILTSRKVKDALTGRMDTISLWPLSQSEVRGGEVNFVDSLFASTPPWIEDAPVGRDAFAATLAEGGYPEARRREGERRRRWFRNYVDTILDRDLRELSDAIKLDEMPRLLRLLASQAANLLSYRGVAKRLGLHHDTVKAYVTLLEQTFLVKRLPAWRPGIGAREVATPKIYLVDSGLLAYLLAADEQRIRGDDQVTGKALENFVAVEVLKHLEWAKAPARLHHYQRRDADIDLVLEASDSSLVAIEVKVAATVTEQDTKRIRELRDRRGERFRAGVVLCSRAETVPLGDRIWAVPISGLWA